MKNGKLYQALLTLTGRELQERFLALLLFVNRDSIEITPAKFLKAIETGRLVVDGKLYEFDEKVKEYLLSNNIIRLLQFLQKKHRIYGYNGYEDEIYFSSKEIKKAKRQYENGSDVIDIIAYGNHGRYRVELMILSTGWEIVYIEKKKTVIYDGYNDILI